MKTTTPKPLLALDSITYLRRLAKELNKLTDGFYYEGERYFQASAYTLGDYGRPPNGFRICRPHEDGAPNHRFCRGMSGVNLKVFTDAQGRTVCASRKS